jgi:light-regulated signal transduction histidine kinase (bacteriophytochrome)
VELVRSNAELAAANKELDAFTYSVAHDLRAPLRHIDGFSRILLDQAGPQLDSQAQHSLHRIQGGVAQMGRLVDDLLNLGRLGRTALHRQRVGLTALVQTVVAELELEAMGRQIDWRIDELPYVECDPGLMKLVFFNLLSNSVKYTRRQKSPVIEVGHMAMDGEPTIFVRDNGIGFNMKHVDKLFGIFQRLHGEEDFEGTGVGLATVQRIIHKHGGHVRAEAEPYRGATFYFTLGVPERGETQSDAVMRAGSCQQKR